MIPTFSALTPYASLLLFLLQLIFAIILLVMRSKFATREEFNSLKSSHETVLNKQEKADLKMAFMEKSLESLPKAEDIHQLSLQMTKLEGALGTMNERFKGANDLSERMQRQVDLMDEWLKRRT